MRVTRRSFLKLSGGVLAASGIGISLKPVSAYAKPLKIKYAKETTTICPYCSVGCSIIISTTSYGKVINTEGDPDEPHQRRRAVQQRQRPSSDERRQYEPTAQAPLSRTL